MLTGAASWVGAPAIMKAVVYGVTELALAMAIAPMVVVAKLAAATLRDGMIVGVAGGAANSDVNSKVGCTTTINCKSSC